MTQEGILEILQLELGSIYNNIRFEDGRYNGYSAKLTQLNVFLRKSDDETLWNHILNLSLEKDMILVYPSIYLPLGITLPYAFDLNDPNSIEELCTMLDKCGGKRNV